MKRWALILLPLLLAYCCPKQDCISPSSTLMFDYNTGSSQGSFSIADIDTTYVITYFPSPSRSFTDTWFYRQGKYYHETDTAAFQDISVSPYGWDSAVVITGNRHRYLMTDFREQFEFEKTEFGCRGCSFVTSRKITVNNIQYDCLKQLQSTESEVDVYDGVLHFKNQ